MGPFTRYTSLPILWAGLALMVAPCPVAEAATIRIYGLESVRFDNVYDPGARPEQLRLVSGSLKLTGSNKWEMVSHIPRRSAAPKSDYGIYYQAADRLFFYSFLTYSHHTGIVDPAAGEIRITKISRTGESQHEVWYIVR